MVVFFAGMPLLPWLAIIVFFVAYWVDKWLLLRVCRTPPAVCSTFRCRLCDAMYSQLTHDYDMLHQYSDALVKSVGRYMPYIIVLHLVVTCLQLGNKDILFTESLDVRAHERVGTLQAPRPSIADACRVLNQPQVPTTDHPLVNTMLSVVDRFFTLHTLPLFIVLVLLTLVPKTTYRAPLRSLLTRQRLPLTLLLLLRQYLVLRQCSRGVMRCWHTATCGMCQSKEHKGVVEVTVVSAPNTYSSSVVVSHHVWGAACRRLGLR